MPLRYFWLKNYKLYKQFLKTQQIKKRHSVLISWKSQNFITNVIFPHFFFMSLLLLFAMDHIPAWRKKVKNNLFQSSCRSIYFSNFKSCVNYTYNVLKSSCIYKVNNILKPSIWSVWHDSNIFHHFDMSNSEFLYFLKMNDYVCPSIIIFIFLFQNLSRV